MPVIRRQRSSYSFGLPPPSGGLLLKKCGPASSLSRCPSPRPFSPTIALLAVSAGWHESFAEALKPLGLTSRKYALLGHIRVTPGISFSELARRSRITAPSPHIAVAALKDAGLVDDATARAGAASHLEVTGQGERLLGMPRRGLSLSTRHPLQGIRNSPTLFAPI